MTQLSQLRSRYSALKSRGKGYLFNGLLSNDEQRRISLLLQHDNVAFVAKMIGQNANKLTLLVTKFNNVAEVLLEGRDLVKKGRSIYDRKTGIPINAFYHRPNQQAKGQSPTPSGKERIAAQEATGTIKKMIDRVYPERKKKPLPQVKKTVKKPIIEDLIDNPIEHEKTTGPVEIPTAQTLQIPLVIDYQVLAEKLISTFFNKLSK